MKKLFITLAALLLTFSVQVQADDFETAAQAVKNMGPGWNLGNTLDANGGTGLQPTEAGYWGQQGLDSETYWGQPVTKPELIIMMKEAGFGAIRVPVTWYNHMDKDGNVDKAWMKRVHEVVDYVIDAGLYCVLNVHHDTGADGSPFISWLKASTSRYNQYKDKFEGLWKQIAEEFKDYDQHLLFEGYNEMLDEKNTWNEPVNKTDGYQAINNYAKSFVTTVRATGGNNGQRNLIINTYSGSNSANAMKALELPEESGHIAFEVHNYPDWQSESHARELVDYLINTLKTNLISKGAPVIVGEYSTLCTWPERDWYYENRDVALYAMKYFIQRTKAEGIGTFYWMGLSDGAYRSTPAFNQADIAETITKAWHGDSFQGIYPTVGGDSGGWATAWEGEQALMWSTWLKIEGTMFAAQGDGCILAITYTQKAVNSDGGDLQFWFADWSSKITVKVGDKEFAGDFNPDEFYGTTDQTYTTLFTFSEDTYKKICQKGFMLDGQNVVLKKIALTSATGIQPVLFDADHSESNVYSLSGQRVTNPTKGIYIRNGKKFIVR